LDFLADFLAADLAGVFLAGVFLDLGVLETAAGLALRADLRVLLGDFFFEGVATAFLAGVDFLAGVALALLADLFGVALDLTFAAGVFLDDFALVDGVALRPDRRGLRSDDDDDDDFTAAAGVFGTEEVLEGVFFPFLAVLGAPTSSVSAGFPGVDLVERRGETPLAAFLEADLAGVLEADLAGVFLDFLEDLPANSGKSLKRNFGVILG